MTQCEISLKAYSGGQECSLNGVCGFILSEYDGLGVVNTRRLAQRSPAQNGDTDLGFRLDPRIVLLAWTQQGAGAAELWNFRAEMLGIFRPRTDDPVTLHFGLPNGLIYATDVNLTGELDHKFGDRLDGKTQRVVAALKASDYRLYNPIQQVLTFSIIDGYEGWSIEEPATSSPYANNTGWDVMPSGVFQVGNGWNIGQADLFIVTPIYYAQGAINADVEFPIIRLIGPISSPIITNQTTGETLPFTNNGGLILGIGEWVEIDLNFSEKTAINQSGNDVSQYLDTDNDLATFHLSYNTELLNDGSRSTGENIISVAGGGVTPQTSIEIYYYERFIGV